MTNLKDYLGKRVRLATVIDTYPVGVFEPGLTGVVSDAQDDGPEHDQYVWVLLDQRRQELDEWGNRLQVWQWPNLPVSAQIEPVSVNDITLGMLRDAARIDDVDRAALMIMEVAGITGGSIAGQHLIRWAWHDGDRKARLRMLGAWLEAESLAEAEERELTEESARCFCSWPA